ncbi:MSHA biogenesis protein MshJ [Psychromonas marina]|uniref:MSHA biogenesis protein MshJ n=1 Tax=Psychromonas marina TaxID=88364 RepID=A0ABQ6DWW9_9GAMM|nr:type II secretion system protein GspM [Psychromonas marina]GLS89483.1 MSHA biogenesis protein MshJ [Psychromonas marina]
MSKFSYAEMTQSFNNLSLRERVIMFVAVILCSFLITYFWILDPASIQQRRVNSELQKSYQQQDVLDNEIEMITRRLQQDPLEEINNKIAFAESTLAQLNQQLDDKLVKFIHAQQMAIALTKVLSKNPGVKISGLKSLPVKVFNASKKATEAVNPSLFYQHTLEITLQGNYNAIYQYLLNVETLKEKFYWYSLDYKVSDYPLAEVTIQIYTLSDQQDLVSG